MEKAEMATLTRRTQSASSITVHSWALCHLLLAYFFIAFAGTWALTIPLALSTGFHLFSLPDPVFILLFIISIDMGPFLSELFVTRATEGKAAILLVILTRGRLGNRPDAGL